jgi:hypothetical protein
MGWAGEVCAHERGGSRSGRADQVWLRNVRFLAASRRSESIDGDALGKVAEALRPGMSVAEAEGVSGRVEAAVVAGLDNMIVDLAGLLRCSLMGNTNHRARHPRLRLARESRPRQQGNVPSIRLRSRQRDQPGSR